MWLSGKRICLQCRRCSGDPGSIPGLGRSPGEENGNVLQYSCLESPMESEAWWATVHGGHKELDTTERLNNKQGLGRNWRVCLPLRFLVGAASQWRISSPRCEELVWCWIDQKTKVKITPGKIKQTQNSNPNKTRQMFLLGDLRNQIFFNVSFLKNF